MTSPGDTQANAELAAARLKMLQQMMAVDHSPPDLDEIAAPLYWPSLTAADAGVEWRRLREWVDNLRLRFGHLDHHVIPPCWWRHNGHVEALQALRDAERVLYADSSPGTGALDWHRSFRDIELRLREWTGHFGCGSEHADGYHAVSRDDTTDFGAFVDSDIAARRDLHVSKVLADGD